MELKTFLEFMTYQSEVNVGDELKLDNRDGLYKVVEVKGNMIHAKHPKTKDIVVFTKGYIEKIVK